MDSGIFNPFEVLAEEEEAEEQKGTEGQKGMKEHGEEKQTPGFKKDLFKKEEKASPLRLVFFDQSKIDEFIGFVCEANDGKKLGLVPSPARGFELFGSISPERTYSPIYLGPFSRKEAAEEERRLLASLGPLSDMLSIKRVKNHFVLTPADAKGFFRDLLKGVDMNSVYHFLQHYHLSASSKAKVEWYKPQPS